jgi:hypothetical protein
MSVATASKTAAGERLYLVDYARGRHRYLYSFSELRVDEVLDVIRGQGDDPEYPMSDMDCLRLLNAVKMAKLLAVGGCMDASGSFAHCFVYCVGVAKPTHVTAHEAAHVPDAPKTADAIKAFGTGQVDGFGAVESVPIKGDSGSSLAGDIGAGDVRGCFLLAIGFCFWAFIALSVCSAVLGLNLLVSLFSLFAGR